MLAEGGSKAARPVDGLRQPGQWFNLKEMKRISPAPYKALSVNAGRSGHCRGKIRPGFHFICQTTKKKKKTFNNILETA